MLDYSDFDERRIKHLELVQAVIGRLGNDSFLLKGWAVTVSGAFFGFAVNAKSWELALASVLPTLAFWGLDAYFLRNERLFRQLYEHVRRDRDVEPFFMGATSAGFKAVAKRDAEKNPSSWWNALLSASLSSFYGALLTAAGVVWLAICAG